ncbi:GtrA family protein [Eubacterium aggregans]|uniref:GtrA family protein n=1 Tax=Eubacterium aggregans TaxID=81409 RepID=UPI003F374608
MENLIRFIKSELFKEIFRFGITGGLSFVVDYALLFLLTEFGGLNCLLSSGISFTVSVVVNYFLCVLWVFEGVQEKQKSTKSVVLFVGSSIVGLLINQILMWFFVEIVLMYYMFAKIIATIIVIVWNYVMKRKAIVY